MVVQDLAGNVVDGASVHVYLAETSTPATSYWLGTWYNDAGTQFH